MTPLERADKVREVLKFGRDNGSRFGEHDLMDDAISDVPPGSLILTPDEAETVRGGIEGCLHATAPPPGATIVVPDWAMDAQAVLALLAGKGQT